MSPNSSTLGWLGIVRLGLVQTALGAIVVLTTSTLNRVMVVELQLAAMLPGFLVGLHSALQISRPLWGHASDGGRRRTPWIVGGMAVLAVGGVLAAQATALMEAHLGFGIGLAVLAYLMVGAGVGAAGTSLLAFLASRVDPARKAAAASIVWLMMIFGFIVTTAVAGAFLEPFSFGRLVEVSATVSAGAFALSMLALYRLEDGFVPKSQLPEPRRPFGEVLAEVWSDAEARAFTIFVFVAMLAYNTQDLILEPFAGVVFGLSPKDSTQLTSVQHSGVFIGMVLVAVAASGRARHGTIKLWTIGGCVLSGIALFAIAALGYVATEPNTLRAAVAVMGFANGAFAVAAIGWMMALASAGGSSREGIRMGLWGGAQAIAFALGAFVGTAGVDLVRYTAGTPVLPYAAVFVAEGLLFFVAAGLAARMASIKTHLKVSGLISGALSPEDVTAAELGGSRAT